MTRNSDISASGPGDEISIEASLRAFRDAFVNTGVVVHGRMVGDPDDVLARVKRLWTPGLKLIVVTCVQEPEAQRRLYEEIHRLCV